MIQYRYAAIGIGIKVVRLLKCPASEKNPALFSSSPAKPASWPLLPSGLPFWNHLNKFAEKKIYPPVTHFFDVDMLVPHGAALERIHAPASATLNFQSNDFLGQ
ncbi:MAG: hypothetical protein LBT47_08190 [Deltaproteobacteria bacterium]|jgi:hypothetical protein|nr:hypothetical protein [Deltaproteobacteria bacterium]